MNTAFLAASDTVLAAARNVIRDFGNRRQMDTMTNDERQALRRLATFVVQFGTRLTEIQIARDVDHAEAEAWERSEATLAGHADDQAAANDEDAWSESESHT